MLTWTAARGWHDDHPNVRPCPVCASCGRLTWQDDDGTCRRASDHPGMVERHVRSLRLARTAR